MLTGIVQTSTMTFGRSQRDVRRQTVRYWAARSLTWAASRCVCVVLLFTTTTSSSEETRWAPALSRRAALSCTKHSACSKGLFCESVYYQCSPCNRCQFDGDSVDFQCPRLRCPRTPIQSRADVLSPMLRSISMKPPSVRVMGANERVYVTVQMEVADDVSGFKMAELILTSVSHSSSFLTYVVDASTSMNPPAAADGGWTTQLWQGSFWFQSGDEAGPWTLTRLRLRDHAANYREYATNDLFLLGAQQNATVDVGSRIRIACTSDAWIKCASSGGRCQAPTPSNPPESSSVCVCSNMPNRASNQLVCLSDTVLDFSNASFWDGSGKLDGSGISPRNVGVTWSGVLDDAVAPDTTSVASQQQATSVEDRETPWQPPPDTSETGRDVWASTVTARSIISILMPCMGVMLCVHACRRIRYLRSLRRINRGEASMSSLPDVRSPSAQPGWMRGLLWRHARQVDRRRELVSQRDADLAAQGLRAQVDTSGRIISLLALHPEQAAHNSLESWRMRGGEAGYEMPLPQNGRLGQVPTAPARVAMPAHLLPGAVNNQGGDKMELEDIAEGEECCVCFAARQSARLNPCGHQDLCVGCAEFMLHNSPYCPMCRSPITSVT